MKTKLLLQLTKDGETTSYRLEKLKPDPRVAKIAWRLWTDEGRSYDVHISAAGHAECECQDFIYRHRDGTPCKHLLAAFAEGLLPAPKNLPVAAEPPPF